MATRGRRTRHAAHGCLLALIALAAVGCGIGSEPVQLAIRTDMYTPACHTSFTIGTLVPDAQMGTAIVEDSGGRTVPVLWPAGFSGRRVIGAIEVLNQDGKVIARTGEHYKFEGGYDEDGWRGCDGVIRQ
jgi:hypothetical protein